MEVDEDGQEWLGVEDMAALAAEPGIKRDSVYTLLTKSRRRAAQGRLQPFDMPLPDRRVKRLVTRKAPWTPIAVWTPQWRRETAAAWVKARQEDPSVKYAKVWARPHDDKGRFVPRAEAS